MPAGRPSYKWNETDSETVKRLAAVGIKQREIAKAINISPTTLKKYYDEELTTAATKANAAVAGALFKSAMNGSVAAQIFWCKTRLRWSETNHEVHAEDLPRIQCDTIEQSPIHDPYVEQ